VVNQLFFFVKKMLRDQETDSAGTFFLNYDVVAKASSYESIGYV
jgi:hypothetical protein